MTLITAPGTGAYVFSVTAIEPPPRYADDLTAGPWTAIRVSEAPAKTGPYTLLGEAPLDPPDPDPTHPAARNVTVAGATLIAGWYVFELVDSDGNLQPLAPLYNGQSWRPTVQEVASQSRAYTNRQSQFDDTTSPTADEVTGYITTAVAEIAGRVGLNDDTISQLGDLARTAATWHAAANVEAQRTKDGADTNASFTWKQNSYIACLNELTSQARRGALRLV